MALCWRWILLLLFFSCSSSHSDVFTSTDDLADLLSTEKELVSSLKDYVRAEEDKLEQIKTWAHRLDVLSAAASQDPEGFLEHPVNAFKLIKRLSTEWSQLESLVLQDTAHAFISTLDFRRRNFPDDSDRTGAAKALSRLLDVYQLHTDTIATGTLPGSSADASRRSTLTVDDCYDLGKVAYAEEDYYHAELWMLQALKQLDEGEEPGAADAVAILDHLSHSLLQRGKLGGALEFTRRLLQLNPTHHRANMNLKYFEEAEPASRGAPWAPPPDYLGNRTRYEQLCRGQGVAMTPRRQSRLFCRYYDINRHPKYVIGPVKLEDEWDRPRIVRYHDIVSDAEIQTVKELAKPRLKRAMVYDLPTGGLTTVHYRVSKSAWLWESDHPVVIRINQRVEDITGLDVSTAEALQVANYGMGGHYEPHFDFARKEEPDFFKGLGTGNRIATWLLYMSDVQAGGATVFTDAGAALWPKKGSAVLWFNLLRSGEQDFRTKHAGCPVLLGNKWVSNKWIHERGQEFRRRCGLRESD